MVEVILKVRIFSRKEVGHEQQDRGVEFSNSVGARKTYRGNAQGLSTAWYKDQTHYDPP